VSARRSSGAFSLIEVLCAILILGVGIVGLTEGLTTALRSSKDSELETTAALLAAGRVEIVRADGWLTDGTEEGDGEQGLADYHWRQLISRTDLEGLHEVTITVHQGNSPQPIYELRTLLFDPPVLPNATPAENRRETQNPRRDRRSR
jgi:prepilin-type N-terminal cleavage/methylation domain-containing protein